MSMEQINSAIRSLLKILGTALAAHGATGAANVVNSEDVIGLSMVVAGVVWSALHHKQETPEPKP